MKRLLSLLTVLFGLAVLAPKAEAQQATHTVVRMWKCSPMGAGIRWLQDARPIADEMVAEGKFVGYGVLAHAWGDEWNVVDYFNVDGLDGYFANFAEFNQRVGQARRAANEGNDGPPQVAVDFREACTDHKDVIYAVVPPPSND